MFLEDLNQNIEFLGFQRVDNALNHWRHVDLDIEKQIKNWDKKNLEKNNTTTGITPYKFK